MPKLAVRGPDAIARQKLHPRRIDVGRISLPLWSVPRFPAIAPVLFCGALVAAVHADTATGLSSFEAIEEPLVRFFPATGKFVPDDFVNITDRGDGTFRMFHRYNPEWWDGDRDTSNKDRQRAEVKGLGPHQFHGETFEYTTTWRSSPGFRGTAGFCHIFQLKAVNGDSGAPLVTVSIARGKVTVEANRVGKKIIAREFSWKPDTWQTVRLRIKTSPQADGELLASVDGDEFQGQTGIELSRPDANEYRPKWGLYRRATVNAPMGDDYVEHKNVTARNLAWPESENATLELEARRLAKAFSLPRAIGWLQAKPASAGRDFATASLAALWAEMEPAAAMTWAEKLPAGALRADAIGRIFSRWADQDVKTAAAWLRVHTPDSAMDPIAWLFVTDTTYRYVDRAIVLAAAPLIKDSDLRAKAFEHVLEIWSRTEREAAVDFTTRCPSLTDGQKQAIVSRISARRGNPSTP